jgi:hypothetical protein
MPLDQAMHPRRILPEQSGVIILVILNFPSEYRPIINLTRDSALSPV